MAESDDQDRTAWRAFITEVNEALGLPQDDSMLEPALKLAADVAHRKYRPMAPVTTYLVGLAVGGGMSLTDAMDRVDKLLPPE